MGHQPLAAGLPLASARLSDAVCPSSDASQPEQQEASPSGRVAVGDWQTWKLLLAGGVSGAVSKTATAPLARMTILYQVGALQTSHSVVGLSSALRQVARTEGVAALWKGNGVTMLHRLPYTAANFFLYEQANQALMALLPVTHSGTAGTDSLRRLLAGGFAGSVACTVAYPLDLVRTRLAAQMGAGHHHGIQHAFRSIVAHEGLAGLYCGLRPTLLQAGPNLALNYCAYEGLRSRWMAEHPAMTTPPVGPPLTPLHPAPVSACRCKRHDLHGQPPYNELWGVKPTPLENRGGGMFILGVVSPVSPFRAVFVSA